MIYKIPTTIFAFLFPAVSIFSQENIKMDEKQAEAIATEAYIYGYPLITMDLTKKVMTNVAEPTDLKAPVGQFVNARKYPDASFKDVTAPNADTLYSSAWLDLSAEPYVLHVPDEEGRYYLMPMLNGWTDVFADPGTRTTGTQAADFVITGPGWKGEIPNGLKEYKSATNMVWILGRTYCTGTSEDYKAVHAIQDKYSIKPLSYYGKDYTPPRGQVDPSVDLKTPVRDQVNKLDAATYFDRLAKLMKDNPPTKEDAVILGKMAKIGIVPGQSFNSKTLDENILKAIQKSPKIGLEKIMTYEKEGEKNVNGWLFTTETGTYGTDYIQRALVTAVGLGANKPEDAIYPMAEVDNEGQTLSGENSYVIHFNKGETPPVKGFWSLTMYNDQMFFVDNPLNRYTLSPRDKLKYNEDGSVDLRIQKESPGKDLESNWLPAPSGKFVLMLRMYWPKEAVIDGTWAPPAIKKVTKE